MEVKYRVWIGGVYNVFNNLLDAEIDREMAEKARQSKEEIKRRSEAAAGEFELGRTAEEDLTGQRRIDDLDEDIPFAKATMEQEKAANTAAKDEGGKVVSQSRSLKF